jgi:hypothetical protein
MREKANNRKDSYRDIGSPHAPLPATTVMTSSAEAFDADRDFGPMLARLQDFERTGVIRE